MRLYYKLTLFLLLFIACFCLGCGAKDIDASNDEILNSSIPSPIKTEEVKIAGGDLFLSMPVTIDSFDPLLADSEELTNLLSLIYETPLKYDSSGRLNENLIESWTVDDTKQNFIFKVRDDVYFSNGAKLTADDIVYTAKRILNMQIQPKEETASTQNTQLPSNEEITPQSTPTDFISEGLNTDENKTANTNNSLKPQISGKNRYYQFAQKIDSIEAVDPQTIHLKTNIAGNVGLHFMTFPVLRNGEDTITFPIGTGPYMVSKYTPGSEMYLTPNKSWWKGKPYIESIVARTVADGEQALNYVRSSIIDFTTSDALFAGNYKQPGKIQVLDYTTNYYDCLVPNLLRPIMQDVNVRQAITYGIDRREILSTVLLNHGIPTNLPISPDYFAYDPRYKINNYGDSAAREFLKMSGYRSSPDEEGKVLSITLLISDNRNDAYCKEAARAIKKQLYELGIEVTVDERTPSDYLQALNNGNFDLAYVSYYLDIVPDIISMFDEKSPLNIGHISNNEINAAAIKCSLAITEDELIQSYSELQSVLAARVPQIGLYFRTNSIVCDENIHGITNIRQGMIFNDIDAWYNYVPGQDVNSSFPQKYEQTYNPNMTEIS